MGTAPRLARQLARRVDLLEAMLTPDFFERLPDPAALEQEFARHLVDVRDLQDMLDAVRRWAHGRQFQAGLQVLLGLSSATQASSTLTAIAEIVLRSLLPTAEQWLVPQHGAVPGGAFVVLGFGKLGSRELTIGSDLDLVFVYDAPEGAESDGARPLPTDTYYARLSQRLVSAITAKTAEGELYEIDMRLRPSGNLGPVACSLDAFERYQAETAQVWEHQALTRSRMVAGDPALYGKVNRIINACIARPREPGPLAAAVRAMRERIFREHGKDSPWELKHARGGIVELEFIAQYLTLAHAHEEPRLLTTRHGRRAPGRRRGWPPAGRGGPGPARRLRPLPEPPGRRPPLADPAPSTAARHRPASSMRSFAPRPWPSRTRSRPRASTSCRCASLKARLPCARSSIGSARPRQRPTRPRERECRHDVAGW